MAVRPVFVSQCRGFPLVKTIEVEFRWVAGQSATQARKRVAALHAAAQDVVKGDILEVSRYSEVPAGIEGSAFNLLLDIGGTKPISLESAFQSSKVFTQGGPFLDLLSEPPLVSKRDERLKCSGPLTGFRFLGHDWPLDPPTAFYDWLYLTALRQNPSVGAVLKMHEGFTDIAFNPAKSLNCQARAAALYSSMQAHGLLEQAMTDEHAFLNMATVAYEGDSNSLF